MPITLDILPYIISGVRSVLFDVKNQDLLKLIYDDGEKPYEREDITSKQMIGLVSPLSKERRVFYTSCTGEIEEDATTKIHMFVDNIVPNNRGLADVYIWFQIITHLKIVPIYGKNGKGAFPTQNRHEAILVEMVKALNEKNVAGIGMLTLPPQSEYGYRHQVWMEGRDWVGGTFAMVVKST